MITDYHKLVKGTLLEKIISEWNEKWSKYENVPFANSETYKFSYSFANALKKDIENVLGEDVSLSDETLHKFLNKTPEEASFRKGVLEKIASYSNVEKYDSYLDKTKTQKLRAVVYDNDKLNQIIEKTEVLELNCKILLQNNELIIAENKNLRERNLKFIKNLKRSQRINYLGSNLILLILLIIAFIIAFPTIKKTVRKNFEVNKDFYTDIKNAIEKGESAEFEAYKKLPDIDSTKLKIYFDKTGLSYQKIITLLIENNKKNLILDKSTSSHKIFSISVLSIDANTAVVKSVENWNLHWYNSNSNTMRYNETNEQIHYLIKKADKWYIKNSIFSKSPTLTNTPNP